MGKYLATFIYRCFWVVNVSILAYGADTYFASSAAGSANGTSCANAYAISDPTYGINVSTNWVAGNTLHLCGTITASSGANQFIKAAASGSSGAPITIKFETNAVLAAPYWGGSFNTSGGAIDTVGNSYITIDGGTNGVIQATACGTSNNSSTCGAANVPLVIFANGGSNVTIQNLTLSNIYVHSSVSDENGADSMGIWIGDGSNLTVNNTTIHDVNWAVRMSFDRSGPYSNWVYENNTSYNVSHSTFFEQGSGTGTMSGLLIHNNVCHDWANWDDAANENHHDCFHVSADGSGGSFTGIQIYNNYAYGDPGSYEGSGSGGGGSSNFLFSYPNSGIVGPMMIFNNVVDLNVANDYPADGFVVLDEVGAGSMIVNNTFVNSYGGSYNGGTAPMVGHIYTGSVTFENNLFITLPYWESFPDKTSTSDYNIMYNSPSNGCGGTLGGSCSTYYFPLSNWQAQGFDAHSLTGNPLVSGTVGNIQTYAPTSGGAGVGKGVNLTSLGIAALNVDAAGNQRPSSGSWDIGAFQYASSTTTTSATPPAAPTNLATSVQ